MVTGTAIGPVFMSASTDSDDTVTLTTEKTKISKSRNNLTSSGCFCLHSGLGCGLHTVVIVPIGEMVTSLYPFQTVMVTKDDTCLRRRRLRTRTRTRGEKTLSRITTTAVSLPRCPGPYRSWFSSRIIINRHMHRSYHSQLLLADALRIM